MDNILLGASAASMFVKVLLDILSMIVGSALPKWVVPLLSLPLGVLIVVLLTAYQGTLLLPLDVQAGATIVLTAILTAGTAVGVTELSTRAERARRSGL